MKIVDNAPNTYVKESAVHGQGLFSLINFKKGEVILDYRHDSNWYEIRFQDLDEEQIRRNWYIMLDDVWCETNDDISKFSFINHSRGPNGLWQIEDKLITAARDIVADEEIIIDYRLEVRPTRKGYPNWI